MRHLFRLVLLVAFSKAISDAVQRAVASGSTVEYFAVFYTVLIVLAFVWFFPVFVGVLWDRWMGR